MQLEPYVFFYGRTEEAMTFYKSVFGGEYDLQRFSDSPVAGKASPETANLVMHATFRGPGFQFMASDGPGAGKTIDPEQCNISLSIASSDRAEGQRVFQKLSDGGAVSTPLADAFWGGTFGTVVDKFGVEWMVTTP